MRGMSAQDSRVVSVRGHKDKHGPCAHQKLPRASLASEFLSSERALRASSKARALRVPYKCVDKSRLPPPEPPTRGAVGRKADKGAARWETGTGITADGGCALGI